MRVAGAVGCPSSHIRECIGYASSLFDYIAYKSYRDLRTTGHLKDEFIAANPDMDTSTTSFVKRKRDDDDSTTTTATATAARTAFLAGRGGAGMDVHLIARHVFDARKVMVRTFIPGASGGGGGATTPFSFHVPHPLNIPVVNDAFTRLTTALVGKLAPPHEKFVELFGAFYNDVNLPLVLSDRYAASSTVVSGENMCKLAWQMSTICMTRIYPLQTRQMVPGTEDVWALLSDHAVACLVANEYALLEREMRDLFNRPVPRRQRTAAEDTAVQTMQVLPTTFSTVDRSLVSMADMCTTDAHRLHAINEATRKPLEVMLAQTLEIQRTADRARLDELMPGLPAHEQGVMTAIIDSSSHAIRVILAELNVRTTMERIFTLSVSHAEAVTREREHDEQEVARKAAGVPAPTYGIMYIGSRAIDAMIKNEWYSLHNLVVLPELSLALDLTEKVKADRLLREQIAEEDLRSMEEESDDDDETA